ncbi:MAG: hypothetical protein RI935_655 [Candidatus Parcubacteria bacterium]|jgi:MFS family permease
MDNPSVFSKNKLLIVTYVMTFLYALHYAIPVYATSSYLHSFFNSSMVSATYLMGSVLALIVSMRVALSIKKFHTYNFTVGVAIFEMITLFLFGTTKLPILLPVLFVAHFALQTLLYVSLNIFIETFSKHSNIGSIRGIFLSILHIGILISPLIAGFILKHFSFEVLYTVASLTLLPYLYLVHAYLSHIKDPAYHTADMWSALKDSLKNKNLRAAIVAKFMVECFYAVMVIYTPLYLTTLDIPLTTYLSFIIPIALIPLVLLPYELGRLADTKYGEKEILLIGLLILIVISFTCAMITSSSPYIWAFILFISRVGASFVDTMSFTYYFKKINKEDSSFTTLFVNMYTFGTITVGGLGILIYPFIQERPELMFVILGLMLTYSVTLVLPMKDTR